MIYHLWSGVCFMWWHVMNYWYLLGHYCHLYGKIRQNQVFWRPFCFYADIWKCPMLTESQQLTCWNWWSKEAKSIEKQTIVNKNKVDWAGCWTTPNFAQIGCFYHSLLKIHPIYVNWAPSSVMKTPDHYIKFGEAASQKASTYMYITTMSMWEASGSTGMCRLQVLLRTPCF